MFINIHNLIQTNNVNTLATCDLPPSAFIAVRVESRQMLQAISLEQDQGSCQVIPLEGEREGREGEGSIS
jgi:hypothetical protein